METVKISNILQKLYGQDVTNVWIKPDPRLSTIILTWDGNYYPTPNGSRFMFDTNMSVLKTVFGYEYDDNGTTKFKPYSGTEGVNYLADQYISFELIAGFKICSPENSNPTSIMLTEQWPIPKDKINHWFEGGAK